MPAVGSPPVNETPSMSTAVVEVERTRMPPPLTFTTLRLSRSSVSPPAVRLTSNPNFAPVSTIVFVVPATEIIVPLTTIPVWRRSVHVPSSRSVAADGTVSEPLTRTSSRPSRVIVAEAAKASVWIVIAFPAKPPAVPTNRTVCVPGTNPAEAESFVTIPRTSICPIAPGASLTSRDAPAAIVRWLNRVTTSVVAVIASTVEGVPAKVTVEVPAVNVPWLSQFPATRTWLTGVVVVETARVFPAGITTFWNVVATAPRTVVGVPLGWKVDVPGVRFPSLVKSPVTVNVRVLPARSPSAAITRWRAVTLPPSVATPAPPLAIVRSKYEPPGGTTTVCAPVPV